MPLTLLPSLVAAPNYRTLHAPNHYSDTLQGSKETTILLHNRLNDAVVGSIGCFVVEGRISGRMMTLHSRATALKFVWYGIGIYATDGRVCPSSPLRRHSGRV